MNRILKLFLVLFALSHSAVLRAEDIYMVVQAEAETEQHLETLSQYYPSSKPADAVLLIVKNDLKEKLKDACTLLEGVLSNTVCITDSEVEYDELWEANIEGAAYCRVNSSVLSGSEVRFYKNLGGRNFNRCKERIFFK